MRFKGLDLNLLVAFDSLMRTRSVSRTADELHLSQPAISSALKRLREYFGDEILIPYHRQMLPTAYGESLLPRVRASLLEIEALITTSTRFDPATTERRFRVCCSDYLATAILAPMVRRLATEAPNIRVELLLNDEHSFGQLELGAIDLLLRPESYIDHKMPAEHLLDERHVIVGWRENPIFDGPIDEATFLAAGHIEVAIGAQRDLVFGDRELNLMGKRRRIEAVASSFTIVPALLAKTQRLALMHERLALRMALPYSLAIAEIPFDFPVMREMVQYHPARVDDPGLIWLLQQLHVQVALDQ